MLQIIYKAYAKTGGPTVCQAAMAHEARAVRSGIVGTSLRGTEAALALRLILEPYHVTQIILTNFVAVYRLSSLLFKLLSFIEQSMSLIMLWV